MLKVLSQLYGKYMEYAIGHGLANEIDIAKLMTEYMQSEDAKKIIAKSSAKMMPDMSKISTQLQKKMTEGMKRYMTTYTKSLMMQLAKGLKNAMSVNPEAFVSAIQMNMDEEDMTQMITQLMTTGSATYEDNMKAFGYADLKKPSMILIYPKNFESKEKITNIIDKYNDDMKKGGEDDKVITYSDIVGTLMKSVTEIINQLSMILIAFVGISLVVSSIMIGVITYISVLERKKEIGILRAMGASKGNVANVFNAETFIIGLLAGLLGVGISFALLPVENLILQTVSGGTRMRAVIPYDAAGILIALSIVLTLIGGWIPSRKAAKSDPVTAL
jgi:ABC-type antimicrobial peptide transport system permease subunit